MKKSIMIIALLICGSAEAQTFNNPYQGLQDKNAQLQEQIEIQNEMIQERQAEQRQEQLMQQQIEEQREANRLLQERE